MAKRVGNKFRVRKGGGRATVRKGLTERTGVNVDKELKAAEARVRKRLYGLAVPSTRKSKRQTEISTNLSSSSSELLPYVSIR